MKLKLRRFLALLLLFTMLLSAFGTARVSAANQQSTQQSGVVYNPENPYVLSYNKKNSGTWVYAQFSPFVPSLTYDGSHADGYSIIFGLVDTFNQNTIFENLYCVDMPVDAVDSSYQRLNLSDSTYASAYANKLRAIVANTYPHITVDQLAQASGIQGLTRGEAITGSQMAIWKTAHGDNVNVTDFLATTTRGNQRTSKVQEELNKEKAAYDEGDASYQAAVKSRIERLYGYLTSLPEQAPVKVIASNASFVQKDTKSSLKQNADGTYDVTVHTTVDVQLTGEDYLTLTAYLDEGRYFTSTPLKNGQSAHELVIRNVPADIADDSVTLAIDGVQSGGDVFLVDAEGIRGISQSMIGYLKQDLPVHAETKAEPDRVLRIVKKEKGDNDSSKPLANISFEVYYVGSVDDYRNGKLGLGAVPTEQDIAKYAKAERLVATLTTDADGKASLNLGTEDGVYLVKELPNAAIAEAVHPFFVSLPDYFRCDEETGEPSYEITAYPKNTISTEEVDINKDVTAIDQDSDTFAVGEDHTWIIRTTIPKTIANGISYVITDTLDYRLTYQSFDRVVVAHRTQEGDHETPYPLERDTDYIIKEEDTVDEEGRTVTKLTISLTQIGMQKVAAYVGTDMANYELRSYFIAQINQNAQMGVNIYNQAKIEYINNINKSFEDISDKPEVHTGGTKVIKVDAADLGIRLSGAVFEVYRPATAEEMASENYVVITIGETPHKVVRISFYGNKELTGSKADNLTTGADGIGYIYGLAYGQYYLVETKAPAGYNKLPDPLIFEITASSHLDSTANNPADDTDSSGSTDTEASFTGIIVKNTSGAELPETGGMGTTLFTLGGIMLMCGAAFLLLHRSKKMLQG